MTKSEHKAKHPTAWEIVRWNRNNEEKYTKAEHKATHPTALDTLAWNRNNKEKYTPEEINESKKIL